MSIDKVGTFDGLTLSGWTIDQSDGRDYTIYQLAHIDSVFHNTTMTVAEVDKNAKSDETTPTPIVRPLDKAPLTEEVVANVAEPEEVRPVTRAARSARNRW